MSNSIQAVVNDEDVAEVSQSRRYSDDAARKRRDNVERANLTRGVHLYSRLLSGDVSESDFRLKLSKPDNRKLDLAMSKAVIREQLESGVAIKTIVRSFDN